MSAWIVSKEHIDVLVRALGERELVGGLSPDEIGRDLWLENVRSIHARYPDTAEKDDDYPGPVGFRRAWAEDYRYTPPTVELTLDGLLKQVRCFDYQTCEHSGWGASPAYTWTTALEEALERAGASAHSEAYDKAPWGVD